MEQAVLSSRLGSWAKLSDDTARWATASCQVLWLTAQQQLQARGQARAGRLPSGGSSTCGTSRSTGCSSVASHLSHNRYRQHLARDGRQLRTWPSSPKPTVSPTPTSMRGSSPRHPGNRSVSSMYCGGEGE